jgi:transposase
MVDKRRKTKTSTSRTSGPRSVKEALVESAPMLVHRDAAGIDIGSRSHFVAVPEDRDEAALREFPSFTSGLEQLADWLEKCRIKTVAMESTGVYWIPVYELLEERGFEVLLVCASHLRNVPGRKSDVLDSRWIQRLHSFGLLRASFRPTKDFVELRAYMRQRARLVIEAARNVQHMQKALLEMNLQLHHVISDITGETGMRIVRAIVAGQRDGDALARLRDPRCKEPLEVIAAALQGTYKDEHLFTLKQSLAAYDFHVKQLGECDAQIEAKLTELEAASVDPDKPVEPLPAARRRTTRGHQPRFDARSPLHRICNNVDLTQIPGIAPATALNLVAEIGNDMSKWPTAKHFTSWLNLAPGTKITGSKSLSGKRGPSKNRAGLALRQAAVSVGKTKTALGGFFHRLAAHRGAIIAVVATARKLGALVYNALKFGQAYVEQGLADYEEQQAERKLRSLKNQAAARGYVLTPLPAGGGVT